MFCPRCGEQNELVQGFCRRCGQALAGVVLALEGRPEQSLEKLKAAAKWINAGSTTISIFTLVGIANVIFGLFADSAPFAYIAMVNVILGLAIGLPLIFAGRANLKRAARLLSKSDIISRQASLDRAQTTNNLLTTGADAELGIPVRGSVTENTTLNLPGGERVRGNQVQH